MKKILAILFVLSILCGCSNNSDIEQTTTQDPYIYAPSYSRACIGINHNSIVQKFKKAGFSNIEEIEIMDLTSSEILSDEDVSEITINGIDDFSQHDQFERNAKVVITYRTIKRLPCPISSTDAKSLDLESLTDMFSESGFANVSITEVFDLDPDMVSTTFENELKIGYDSNVSKNDLFPFDSQIEIICHKPYEKYTVKLDIDFMSNLLFSKYDVNILIDGYVQETLEHGVDKTFELRLKEGNYRFSFEKATNSAVKGEVTLDVNSDIDAAYRINCKSDLVNVENLYIDRKTTLQKDDIKVMASKSEFYAKNYESVIKTLKEWGFTDIQEVPQYDIILGWTDEGAVENVTIDGVNTYKRGDIFKNHSKVIVYYHLLADDDPAKIKPPYTTDSAKGKYYLDVGQAFEDAGFTNISYYTRIDSSADKTNKVANIFVDGRSSFDLTDGFYPDAEVEIYFYTLSSSSSKSDTSLSSSYARIAFENYGEQQFPYGFKCHWFVGLIHEEQLDDGSWYFKVEVTIENAYGNKIDTVAEGIVSGTDASPVITQFHVNLP